MVEMSINYEHQMDSEEGYINIRMPLFPVKYQIRSFHDKRLGHDRTIIYFQYPTRWKVQLHMDFEEELALIRKLVVHTKKRMKAGDFKLFKEHLISEFMEALESG